MKKNWMVLLAGLITTMSGCVSKQQNLTTFGDTITVTWKLTGISERRSTAAFVFENKGQSILGNSGWSIYFNQIGAAAWKVNDSSLAGFEHINGDFFRLNPGKSFVLEPGNKITVSYICDGRIIKESHAPEGLYFVFTDGTNGEQVVPVRNYTVSPFIDDDNPGSIFDAGEYPVPTSRSAYTANIKISQVSLEKTGRIIPTPVSIKDGREKVYLSATDQIYYQTDCKNEAIYLSSVLEKLTGVRIDIREGSKTGINTIVLKTDKIQVSAQEKEAYHLSISKSSGISITGSDRAGVFYGIQSFLALIPTEIFKTRNSTFAIRVAEVKDAPRFSYRGFHLDVARNFSKKKSILKLLDLLAFYKINTLHFHLTDDEGWRIEIPSLPELTQVGSKRGHTVDDRYQLQPAYGSGPMADAEASTGTGYYTTEDFIDILRYAYERHIQIIPEINGPGHSRAAIKSMENRYYRLMSEGKTDAALEYRLTDPNDSSVYSSAQAYKDNVLCVALESVYRFYETVTNDLRAIYDKANVPFTFIHTGGDEVPRGVWVKSPECIKLLKEHPEIGDPQNLQGYFLGRLVEVLSKLNLTIGGWEEVAMLISQEGWKPNPAFIDKKVIPFVWNSLGSNLDLGYRLANAGYPIILCNVSNFYFDLAYNADPKEPGLHWGGFVDTRKVFDFIPYDEFKSSLWDDHGQPVAPETAYRDMERLKPEAREKILGIQAELWSETLKNPDMLEYYILPKLLGLAERAWSQAPLYETIENSAVRASAVDAAWNTFANKVGVYEFPRLDYIFGGFNYRISPPGAIIKDGRLYANMDFPGFVIRYTTDGTEPDKNSEVYNKPVQVSGMVKLKAFNGKGRAGRTVQVKSDE